MVAERCLLLKMHTIVRLPSGSQLMDEKGEHTPRLTRSNGDEESKGCYEDSSILSCKSESSSFG